MKKNNLGKITVTAVITLILLSLATGCCDEKSSVYEVQKDVIKMPSNIAEGNLSEDAIIAFNEAFAAVITDENGNTSATEISCFFTSYYDNPKNIDFPQFMRYCPLYEIVDEDEEYQKVKAAALFELPEKIDELPTPLRRYNRTDIDRLLGRYADITTADLTRFFGGNAELVYVEDLDAFYNFTSDFGPGSFTAIRGTRKGDIYTLTDDRNITLKLEATDTTDSGFRILSFK